MKKGIFIYLVVGVFFYIGCQDENLIEVRKSNGKIAVGIQKSLVPQNVTQIKAILSREGFQQIIGYMNLLEPNSAEILFENIPAGNWNIRIEAYSSGGTLLYAGESSVLVQPDIVTNVNLVLNPVSNSTGSVYIYVTWGSGTQSDWIDYPGNPILVYSGPFSNPYGIRECHVLKEESGYKMWYASLYENAYGFVFYATSTDGLNWIPYSMAPVMWPGPFGSWDSGNISPGPVIKKNDQYIMYYKGFTDQYSSWSIGMAVSNDGVNWVKHGSPVVMGDVNSWDSKIVATSIVSNGDEYLLYYVGKSNSTNYKVGLAKSIDGVNWVKHSQNPILTPTNSWEGTGIHWPSVVKEGNNFLMTYGNGDAYISGFGLAYSEDGINWIKDENNPVFTTSNTINNYSRILYPTLINDNSEFRIYYTGEPNYQYSMNINITSKPKPLFK